jgi:protein-ribulosamine 3-kinase
MSRPADCDPSPCRAEMLLSTTISATSRMKTNIHPVLLYHLSRLESGESFTSHGSRIESSSGRQYFAKVGSWSNYEQWTGEAESLRAMHEAAPSLAPELFAFGLADENGRELPLDASHGTPFFLSSYLDHVGLSESAAIALGKRLGLDMHRYTSSNGLFGFHVPTYCGVTRFSNGWHPSWAVCFSAMIGDMLGYLQEQGKYQTLQKKGDEMRKRWVSR